MPDAAVRERGEPAAGPWWSRTGRSSVIRFAAFGLLGLATDVGLLWLFLSFLTASRPLAVTLAFAVTYAMNFTLNRRYSFAAQGPVSGQLTRFLPQVLADYALTLTAVGVLTGWGIGVLAARILAGGTNAALNYAAYRFWTFRRPRRAVTSAPNAGA